MKLISSIALGTILVAACSSVFADTTNENTDSSSHVWGGVNAKYWVNNYNPSEGFGDSQANELMTTFAIGYDSLFSTITFNSQPLVSGSTYPTGGIKLQETAFGFGYYVHPRVAVVLGQKTFGEIYFDTATSTVNRTIYNTFAIVFDWKINDTNLGVFGSVATGQGTMGPQAHSGGWEPKSNYQYRGIELGVNYKIAESSKISLGYKTEQMELPYATMQSVSPLPAGVVLGQTGTAKRGGLFTGISFLF